MARIVALRWSPADHAQERACRSWLRRIETERAWVKFLDCRGVLAHYALEPTDRAPLMLARNQGAVFGPLFCKTSLGEARLTHIDTAESEAILDSGGARLMERYWGHYSAWLSDTGRDLFHILREPTGAGACFVSECEGAQIYFTHAEDFLRLRPEAKLNGKFLTAFLAYPRLLSESTALEGVYEILPGMRETSSRTREIETTCVWRPEPRDAQFAPGDFDKAAALLREAVITSAASWEKSTGAIAHRLSGGLDSSIALAALKQAGAENVMAFNEHADGVGESDERVFARAMCAKLDVPLQEVKVAATDVDYRRLTHAPFSPKPSATHIGFAVDTIADAFAAFDANALVTSGQGGDQVFHRSHASTIAADAWRDGLTFASQLRIGLDTARLARKPVWTVWAEAAKALAAAPTHQPFFGAAGWDPPRDVRGVALSPADLASPHPWAAFARSASPARAERITYVADLQYYHQRDAVHERFQVAPFLASQSVVEVCLRVPPYVMTQGGRDRALARAAFADLLPEAIEARTDKASTARFHAAALERQMPFFKEMLMDGRLAQEGLIQRDALTSLLSGRALSETRGVAALYPAVIAEMWLREFYDIQDGARAAASSRGELAEPPAAPD